MSIRQFEPSRAVEIIAPRYGSGYRIGGRLVLTAAHLLDVVGSECEVRDKRSFGQEKAQVVWQAQGLDIALIELPEKIAGVAAITLGKLPEGKAGEKIRFQMYGYPRWGWIQRDEGSAASGLQVEGTIYLADTAPEDVLVLRIDENLASEYLAGKIIGEIKEDSRKLKSEWQGMSGAAVICDGLVVAVQSQHPNPMQPNYTTATPLSMVNDDKQWQQLLKKHDIDPELKTARLPTIETVLEINWHEDSLKLLEKRLQLTTNPMTRGENIDYSVEQVYVPLGLVERKKVPRQKGDVLPERGSDLFKEDREPEQTLKKSKSPQDSETEEIEVTQKFEYAQFLEQVLHKGQSPKSQGKRVAIIGEPGSGKTTLLQQIARWVADQFPASVVIWVSLADLGQRSLKQYVYETWLTAIVEQYGQAEVSVPVKNAFIAQCQQGHVWLLLDGLDEMPVTGNPLEEGGWLEGTRSVLTCRLNLWTGKPLAGFDVFRTLEFSYPQQVEQFIAQWFRPQGKADLGQALCAALKEPGKERIRDLVKNPLRLTLLCYSWPLRQKTQLPETKAELYQWFTKEFYKWNEGKTPNLLAKTKLDRMLGELAKLAIDQKSSRFRLSETFVNKFLNEDNKFLNKDNDFLSKEDKSILFSLALQLGWLNRVGVAQEAPLQEVFAFFHTTFQEYFAALAINDWDFFLPREHQGQPVRDKWKYKPYRIFEPQWKEVFLLWLGRSDIKKEEKEQLIRSLVEFKDGCKEFYSDRAFLLAAEGISEFRADDTLRKKIVDQLLDWRYGVAHPKTFQRKFVLARARAGVRRVEAGSILKYTHTQTVIQCLQARLATTENEKICGQMVLDLGELDPDNDCAIDAFESLLSNSQDPIILKEIFYNLPDIENWLKGNKKIINILVNLLKTTQNEDTLVATIFILTTIGIGNKTIIQALIDFMEATQDDELRRATIERLPETIGKLETIDLNSATIIHMLVECLKATKTERRYPPGKRPIYSKHSNLNAANEYWLETKPDEIRLSAMNILSKVDSGKELVIRELAHLLDTPQDMDTYWRIATILGKIGMRNSIAVQALVKLLETIKDQEIFWRKPYFVPDSRTGTGEIYSAVVESLREIGIGIGNQIVPEALVHLLTIISDSLSKPSADDWWRWNRRNLLDLQQSVAETLNMVDKGNEDAIQILGEPPSYGQENNGNEFFRKPYIHIREDTHLLKTEILSEIDPHSEAGIRSLVNRLGTASDDSVRLCVAKILSESCIGNETAIYELACLLNTRAISF